MKEVNAENQKNNDLEEEYIKIPKKLLDSIAGDSDISGVLALIVETCYQDQYPECYKNISCWNDDELTHALNLYEEIITKYNNELMK